METKKSRSGSRAPLNPKTKAQRLVRLKELTDRLDARADEIETLSRQREAVIVDLHEIDSVAFAEMGRTTGKSGQAFHKAYQKAHARNS